MLTYTYFDYNIFSVGYMEVWAKAGSYDRETPKSELGISVQELIFQLHSGEAGHLDPDVSYNFKLLLSSI